MLPSVTAASLVCMMAHPDENNQRTDGAARCLPNLTWLVFLPFKIVVQSYLVGHTLQLA